MNEMKDSYLNAIVVQCEKEKEMRHMKMNARCIACLINKQDQKLRKESDEDKKLSYMKEVLRILETSDTEETMPWLSSQIDALYAQYYPQSQPPYAKIKRHYNQMMLDAEETLQLQIQQQKDPLAYAIRFACVGNYIDYGALDHVDTEFFFELLHTAQQDTLDDTVYQRFLHDLSQASDVVYICDNCGEIVFDKLLIQQLQKAYPGVKLTAMVRGGEVINDASMNDALQVGLDTCCTVIDNGIAMAGTDLRHIHLDAWKAIHDADLILSKGQANFETLCGNDLPIYYLLLCKCDLFTERFHLPKYKGVFFTEADKNPTHAPAFPSQHNS